MVNIIKNMYEMITTKIVLNQYIFILLILYDLFNNSMVILFEQPSGYNQKNKIIYTILTFSRFNYIKLIH